MGFRAFGRIRVLAVSLATVTATTTLFAIAGAAGPASAAAGSGCPANQKGLATDNQVSASFINTGTTSTYKFSSLVDEHPSGGVPGLMKYCVYPSPVAQPNPITPAAHGDNGVLWARGTGSNNFAFVRPGGNPSNIGLRGQTVTMGTATWASLAAVPASQVFVLHVNDPGVCTSLYGAGSSGTCFVLPAPPPPPTPCSAGDANVAYNAMPSDVVNCVNPGIGFEAQSVSEFGNAVNLSSSAGRNLDSFTMDMQSFACQTGHWNGNPDDPSNTVEPCQFTDPTNPTFQWPVTANIYAVNPDGSPGALLATSGPVTQTIPYRPAHDTTGHCTNLDNNSDSGNRWWNPAALGGAGACQSSIATVLSFSNFTAPGGGAVAPLPGQVIWTVSFATTDNGTPVNPPQGVQACSSGPDPRFPGLTDGGCPYDSLNPGDNGNNGGTDFPASHITNAPYAGSDVTTGVAYLNQGGTGLQSQTGFAGLRPLGEIITH